MADKEATVYIIDVRKSMGEKNNGREETDLEFAMHYVWDKITTTVQSERKTWLVGVIGLGTDDTNNPLFSADPDEPFQNISVLHGIEQMKMPDLRALKDEIKPSSTNEGDAISSLVIAVQMIAEKCKKLKYNRRINLVTNGRGAMDADGLEGIIDKIKEDDMELTILGVDFDDSEYGFQEREKDPTKAESEEIFRHLTEECNGLFGTMGQAVAELGTPRVKSTRPIHSYRGYLTLGKPEDYESAMEIPVERYPKVRIARPPTASQYVVRHGPAPGEEGEPSTAVHNGHADDLEDKNDLAAVKNSFKYRVEDAEASEGKREVDREDLAKGYKYGQTAVPISESDQSVTKLHTEAGFEIIGFVPAEKYDRYFHMSPTNMVIASRTDDKASMALSAFIHALFEVGSYAVTRFVAKDESSPLILLLAPSIEPDYECLIDVELPFAEDMRNYRFPPLDRVTTRADGTKIKQSHRFVPNDELMKTMSDYVDAMDLSTAGTDEDGNPAEYAPFGDTYSPTLHYITQILRWRAVHPTEPIPPPYEILTRYSQPPGELLESAQPALNALIKAADVKKVPPKQKSRKRGRDTEKPKSGLDIDALLASNRPKRAKISAENAIPEFKQLLETTESLDAIHDATNQLGVIIEDYIRHSFGDSGYGRATEALRVMREEMTEMEEPGLYNDFVKALKDKLLAGELGGERKEMWYRVRVNRLGLIHKKMSSVSEVDEDEAKAFLSGR